MFSQTADEILQNVKGIPHKFFFSHRKPIPECFEQPTQKALVDETITHLWFVEDDMILPSDTLQKLLAMDKAVVTADYPVNKDGRGSIFSIKGQIVFTGTGCLLVKREVFDELQQPYFRTDFRWNIKNYGDHLKMTSSRQSNLAGYGLHDVNFGMNLYAKNIPIHAIDTVLGQRKLIALGKAGSNDGAHNIEAWTKVKPNHLLNEVKKWPVEKKGELVSVTTPTGEVFTSKKHAAKLVKEKLGYRTPRKYLVVDWSEE
jgi:hypothetical protein